MPKVHHSLAAMMAEAQCSPEQIRRFELKVEHFLKGERTLLPEAEVVPVQSLPKLNDLEPAPDLLKQVAVVKLNGGLGTSMGLSGPKGLLRVRHGKDFYSLTLEQLKTCSRTLHQVPPLIFMNSFHTDQATQERLSELGFEQAEPWSFLQAQVPKVTDEGLPVEVEPEYAWCPPGHGDIYASLLDTGLCRTLWDRGVRYLFVSNIDNLGATLDSRPLGLLKSSGAPFLMETTRRRPEDRKGGHLALDSRGHLILREVAQCPPEDLPHFQDTERHQYFNTNNIWITLEALEESWTDLPLIVNRKPARPHDPSSPEALQLESAMGAVIGQLQGALAVEVDRDRFLPVKTTNDLFRLRSDLYHVNSLGVPETDLEEQPQIDLDPECYGMIEGYQKLVLAEPSLRSCRSLKVRGPVTFRGDEKLIGDVVLDGN